MLQDVPYPHLLVDGIEIALSDAEDVLAMPEGTSLFLLMLDSKGRLFPGRLQYFSGLDAMLTEWPMSTLCRRGALLCARNHPELASLLRIPLSDEYLLIRACPDGLHVLGAKKMLPLRCQWEGGERR